MVDQGNFTVKYKSNLVPPMSNDSSLYIKKKHSEVLQKFPQVRTQKKATLFVIYANFKLDK